MPNPARLTCDVEQKTMSAATQDSWKTLPPPSKKEALGFDAVYTDLDAEKIRGLIPKRWKTSGSFIFERAGFTFTEAGPALASTVCALTVHPLACISLIPG